MSDDTRYSITRKPTPRVTREELEKAREAAGVPAEAQPAMPATSTSPTIELPRRMANGSRPGMAMPGGAPRSNALKVEYGDVELIVEHRGDEVSIVIPGALRLTAPRAQAMALVAALMKRP
ncbi:MAG: hypothetical protein K8M05_26505 [Deltaproteobacteria bacterium]|nr:hypothetical protein [Kofleriaceae bacterium]